MLVRLDLVTCGQSASFSSSWSRDETLRRLSELGNWHSGSPAIECSVENGSVRLRVISDFRRSNGTTFFGQLQENSSGVSLAGVFTASLFHRVIIIGVLGVLLLMFASGAATLFNMAIASSSPVIESLKSFAFLVLFGGVVALIAALLIWNGSPDRKHVEALSHALRNTLSGENDATSKG